ncbi:flavin reductase [Acetobacter tropicalis]|uniref:flavin reductase n=2 Tax=Acetobacter tropicalis TaxID=104102 RepID=UPI0009DA4F02
MSPEPKFVSSDVFREAMSRLSAPVALVTTDGSAGRYGLTMSAICSVSVEPPTMLVCLNRDNRSHEAFLKNGVIGISILEPGHEELLYRTKNNSQTLFH